MSVRAYSIIGHLILILCLIMYLLEGLFSLYLFCFSQTQDTFFHWFHLIWAIVTLGTYPFLVKAFLNFRSDIRKLKVHDHIW